MIPAITATAPAPPATGDTATAPATPLSTLFANFLNPVIAPADDATTLPEMAEGSLPAIALPPADEPASDTDFPEDPEDLPWPPEGLASLWPPATAPEPAPQHHSSAIPVSSPATGSRSHRVASASLRVALTIQAPEPSESPITTSPQPAPISQIPAATPAIPASPEPSPAPDTAPEPTSLPISPEPEPLSHLWERGWGEGASAATSPITAPSTPPFPLTAAAPTQPQQTLTPSIAPFPAPDLHADNFPDAIGTHIQWLAEHKIGHAHLQLTPQDLGPLEVRLKLDGDQLQAHFTSAEPDVRQAMEHALPRLRELLGEHGLNLGQADIGRQPSPQHAASSGQSDTLLEDEPVIESAHSSHSVHTTHLLDAYA